MCRPVVAAWLALFWTGTAVHAALPLVTATAGASGGYADNPGSVPGEPTPGTGERVAPVAAVSSTLRVRTGGVSRWSTDFRYSGAWERSGATGSAESGSRGPAGEVIWRPGRVSLRGGGAWQERWYTFAGDGGRGSPLDSRGWEGWAAAEFPIAPRTGYGGFLEYRQASRRYPRAIVVTAAAPAPVTGRRQVGDQTLRAGCRLEPVGWCEVQLAWEETRSTGNALGWQSGGWLEWDASRGRGGSVQIGVRPHARVVMLGSLQRSLRRYEERLAVPGPGADRLELTLLGASSSWAFHDRVAAVLGWQWVRCESPTAIFRQTSTRVTAGIRMAATFIPWQQFP